MAIATAVFVADFLSGNALLLKGAKSSAIWSGEIHRLFTASLLHGGILHLLLNLYALFLFGRVGEELGGSRRLVLLFFGAGIIGFIASLLTRPDVLSVGASASIFGLMGYVLTYRLVYLPRRWLPLDGWLLQIIVLNVVLGFSIPGIDQAGHLGGLAGGIALGAVLGYRRNESPDPWTSVVVWQPRPARYGRRRAGVGLAFRSLAFAILLFTVWFGLAPLEWADVLGQRWPHVREVIQSRYARFFLPFRADRLGLYWIYPEDRNAQWQPLNEWARLRPEKPVALGAFWRWVPGESARQSRSGNAAPFAVDAVWLHRQRGGQWLEVSVQRITPTKPDEDPYRVFLHAWAGPFTGRERVGEWLFELRVGEMVIGKAQGWLIGDDLGNMTN